MKLRNILLFCFLGVFLFQTIDADAQRRSKYGKRKRKNKSISKYHGGSVGGRFRPYEFAGFNVNALNYFGDLAPLSKAASTDVSFTRPGFGFCMGYKFNSQMALRGGLNWGRLQGSDFSADPNSEESEGRYLRNLSFRNDIYELQLGAEIYLLPNYGGPNARMPINAYIFFGAALFYHNPKALVPEYDYQQDPNGTIPAPKAGEWVSLRELGTEGQNHPDLDKKAYSPFQVSIPLGIGGRMRLPGTPFDIGMEVGYRFLFTDYIDDVSDQYVKLDEFDSDLARIMSARGVEPVDALSGEPRQGLRIVSGTDMPYYIEGNQGGGDETGQSRGNPKDNDAYVVTTIRLTYVLGSKVRAGAKFR